MVSLARDKDRSDESIDSLISREELCSIDRVGGCGADFTGSNIGYYGATGAAQRNARLCRIVILDGEFLEVVSVWY